MTNKSIKAKFGIHGRVERRLFDGVLYAKAKAALAAGDVSTAELLLKWAAKPLFQHNKLWKFINKHLSVDLKIPFVTGYWTKEAISDNLITTRGKQVVVQQISGATTAPITAIAIGIGATAAAAGNTALGSEITTNGGQRGAATVTTQTTTTTSDTARWVKSFSFTGSFAVTEEGLFDNNTSGGNMLARQVFTAINVAPGDVLQITHEVQAT